MLSQEIIHTMYRVLAHSVWQGAVILLIGSALLAIVPKQRADLRYRILTICLALNLAAPVATAALLFSRNESGSAIIRDPISEARTSTTDPRIANYSRAIVTSAESSLTGRAFDSTQVGRFGAILVGLWLFGVLVEAARFIGGWVTIRGVVSRGSDASEEFHGRLASIAERMGITRRIALVVSSIVDVPFTSGWLRPVIVIPLSMVTSMEAASVDAILMHELAHIRRYDYLVGVLQSIAMTLLYYHPVTWWLDRRLRIEREYCADQIAVGIVRDRKAYIRALAELEERRSSFSLLAMAADGGSLVARVERLTGASSSGNASGLVTVCAVLALLGGPVAVRAADAAVTGSAAVSAIALKGVVVRGSNDAIVTSASIPITPQASVAGAHVTPESSLAQRWASAVSKSRTNHTRDVIGWFVRSDVTAGNLTVSSTDGTSDSPGPAVFRLAGMRTGEQGVAILLTVDDGVVSAARIRSLQAPLATNGRKFVWLGRVEDGESIAHIERLMGSIHETRFRTELGAALSVHDDDDALTGAERRVMEQDDAEVRAETVAWLARRARTDAEIAIVTAALDDPSPRVRDEALSGSFDNPRVDRNFFEEKAQASQYADVRNEISERLSRR
jgi:beta-lactamase regulating signal transducer with metallopeptidase domain